MLSQSRSRHLPWSGPSARGVHWRGGGRCLSGVFWQIFRHRYCVSMSVVLGAKPSIDGARSQTGWDLSSFLPSGCRPMSVSVSGSALHAGHVTFLLLFVCQRGAPLLDFSRVPGLGSSRLYLEGLRTSELAFLCSGVACAFRPVWRLWMLLFRFLDVLLDHLCGAG